MILTKPQTTIRSNGLSAQSFKVEASAKTFAILSSVIYKNPVLAIVRELSCNAFDAHVSAGTLTKPFNIQVPTKLVPVFSIRDYGTGLSHDDMLELYSTYFRSTKAESNDFVGALGIGSKSPFSYTKNFTVVSYFNGMKQTFFAFINEHDIPSISHVGTEETSEANGLEISFPVALADHPKFFSAVETFFSTWGSMQPTILGLGSTAIRTITRGAVGGKQWFFDQAGAVSRATVIMGNVPYQLHAGTISQSDQYKALTSAQRANIDILLNKPLVIIFAIGDVDFAASREELQYTSKTLKAVLEKLNSIAGEITEAFATKLAEFTKPWDAALFAKTEFNTFGRILTGITPEKFGTSPLPCGMMYEELNDTIRRGIRIDDQYLKALSEKVVVSQNDGKALAHLTESSAVIPVREDFVLCINDSPKGGLAKIRYNFTRNLTRYSTSQLFTFTANKEQHGTIDDAERAALSFAKKYGIPEKCIKRTSALPSPLRSKPLKSTTTEYSKVFYKLDSSVSQSYSRHYEGGQWMWNSTPLAAPASGVIMLTRMGKPLIRTYSDEYTTYTSVGDLLQFALDHKLFAFSDIYAITPGNARKAAHMKNALDIAAEYVMQNYESLIRGKMATESLRHVYSRDSMFIHAMLINNAFDPAVVAKSAELQEMIKIWSTTDIRKISSTSSTGASRTFMLTLLDGYKHTYPDKRAQIDDVLKKIDVLAAEAEAFNRKVNNLFSSFTKKHPVIDTIAAGIGSNIYRFDKVRTATDFVDLPICKQFYNLVNCYLLSTNP